MKLQILALTIIPVIFLSGVVTLSQEGKEKRGGKKMSITITSSAFDDGEMIPVQYTCDGEDISPPLQWEGVPEAAKSLALICDDPDAPGKTWVHWVLFNLPADTSSLQENFPSDATLENGIVQGITDFGDHGYGGPCPPGGTHRYYFKLYALDTTLELDSTAQKTEVLDAMEAHVLAEGQLMGRYERQ